MIFSDGTTAKLSKAVTAKSLTISTVGENSSSAQVSGSSSLRGKSEWSDLHKAAWNGEVQTVTRLLCAGVDVQAKDCDGWTALHRAAHKGNTEIVEMLLQVVNGCYSCTTRAN